MVLNKRQHSCQPGAHLSLQESLRPMTQVASQAGLRKWVQLQFPDFIVGKFYYRLVKTRIMRERPADLRIPRHTAWYLRNFVYLEDQGCSVMVNSKMTARPPKLKKEGFSKLPLGLEDEIRVGKIFAPSLLGSPTNKIWATPKCSNFRSLPSGRRDRESHLGLLPYPQLQTRAGLEM